MKPDVEDDFAQDVPEPRERKKMSACLMTRIAFYGCLAFALATLGIFIVTNFTPR